MSTTVNRKSDGNLHNLAKHSNHNNSTINLSRTMSENISRHNSHDNLDNKSQITSFGGTVIAEEAAQLFSITNVEAQLSRLKNKLPIMNSR